MPWKKIACPTCDGLMGRRAQQCRACVPSYVRSPEHRQAMSDRTKGIPKPAGFRPASTRPEVAAKIAAAWTPEMREAARLRTGNPEARYHGLSCKKAKAIREAVGACQACGSLGRLDIHHRDRNKHNHESSNLVVLCHRCHMQEHARAGEMGWDLYHQKRKNHPNLKT